MERRHVRIVDQVARVAPSATAFRQPVDVPRGGRGDRGDLGGAVLRLGAPPLGELGNAGAGRAVIQGFDQWPKRPKRPKRVEPTLPTLPGLGSHPRPTACWPAAVGCLHRKRSWSRRRCLHRLSRQLRRLAALDVVLLEAVRIRFEHLPGALPSGSGSGGYNAAPEYRWTSASQASRTTSRTWPM